MADFAIRPYRPEDAPFVFRAWLRGYWEHFPGRVIVTEREFMERWHRVIERILDDPRTRTVVAHVEGEPDSLLGFSCCTEHVCFHWMYVKQAFRQLGIGGAMMSQMQVSQVSSHWTPYLQTVGAPEWKYAPELLRGYVS